MNINRYLEKTDKTIGRFIEIKAKKPLGLAIRYNNADNQIRNYILRSKLEVDAVQAIFDDRYGLVWFHRINGSEVDYLSNVGYGRSHKNANIKHDITSIFYCKRDNIDIKNDKLSYNELKLADRLLYLSRMFEGSLIRNFEYNTPQIERDEFGTNNLHAESFLIRMNWEVTMQTNIDCIELDICEDSNFNCCGIYEQD